MVIAVTGISPAKQKTAEAKAATTAETELI